MCHIINIQSSSLRDTKFAVQYDSMTFVSNRDSAGAQQEISIRELFVGACVHIVVLRDQKASSVTDNPRCNIAEEMTRGDLLHPRQSTFEAAPETA
jgi:hypothetical protein